MSKKSSAKKKIYYAVKDYEGDISELVDTKEEALESILDDVDTVLQLEVTKVYKYEKKLVEQ